MPLFIHKTHMYLPLIVELLSGVLLLIKEDFIHPGTKKLGRRFSGKLMDEPSLLVAFLESYKHTFEEFPDFFLPKKS